ncbi:MAG: deacylase [Sedimenticola sp.]|nr:deacylase [Sedimenticola sp.]MCW8947693.1 deacylase [Sedimenticola sp.]MCW8949711.1 deacylase [Sedimenticola sp.]
MRLALRIEVATEAGVREGVPALLRLLDEYQIQASFCISLGPDYSSYPFSDSLPDWLRQRLPVSYIGRKQRDILLSIDKAGHDIGIAPYTAAEWRLDAAYKTPEWVHAEVTRAVDSFTDLYSKKPRFYGALGWQTNANLLAEEELLELDFASDVRGRHAFFPELQGVSSRCPQIPTTLPLLDELLIQPDINYENVHQFLYADCQRVLPNGEVFTLTAEREGRQLLPIFEKLLVMWKGGQWELRSLTDLFKQIDVSQLNRHLIGWAPADDGDHYLATQSAVVE